MIFLPTRKGGVEEPTWRTCDVKGRQATCESNGTAEKGIVMSLHPIKRSGKVVLLPFSDDDSSEKLDQGHCSTSGRASGMTKEPLDWLGSDGIAP